MNCPDPEIYQTVRRNWDSIAKPLDSMGKFEELHARVGAVQGTEYPDLGNGAVLVFCADNGIVAEGVSQSDQSVTRACAVNLGKGETAVCALAKEAGIKVVPVDIGIADRTGNGIAGLLDRRVAPGTGDFLKEPAMTEEQLNQAVRTGVDLVKEMKDRGFCILGIGELGIGNTTTSACVSAALLGIDSEAVVGRGAGLSDEGLRRKREVVRLALEKWGLSRAAGSSDRMTEEKKPDVLTVLRTVGGLDLAGMAGACIGGMRYGVPIVLDGVISMTAALVAERMAPGVKRFLLPSHLSREPAAALIAKELDLDPVLNADMALGEGTGAVMMMSLLRLADGVYRNGVRFESSGVDAYHRYS